MRLLILGDGTFSREAVFPVFLKIAKIRRVIIESAYALSNMLRNFVGNGFLCNT